MTAKVEIHNGSLSRHIIFIIFGIIGVVAGAYLLIESSVCIATFFGIPPFVIAVSIVAVGTSLPELVVSAIASYKDQSDIALGNVLGSNVFNILLILGVSALFIPLQAIEYGTHLFILLGVTLVMVPLLNFGTTISRKKGVILLILYGLFISYIFYFQDIVYQIL